MPIDATFIGRSYPPTPPYEIGRAKIAEFADALGDPNPIYRDPEVARAAGYPDVIAPPTMAVLVSLPADEQPIRDPEVGLDFSRVVHGDQRFVYHRPMRSGDRITAVVTIDTVRAVGANTLVGTRCEAHDQNGEAVFTGYGALVVRGE